MPATTALNENETTPDAPNPIVAAVAPDAAATPLGLDRWLDSGRLVLARALDDHPIDALIVSTGLAESDAVEILAATRARRPGALRLVVTHDEGGVVPAPAMAFAHRVIHKRELTQCLPALVGAAVRLQSVIAVERDGLDVHAALDSLPSLPAPYYEFVAAVRSDDVQLSALADIIERDTVLSARILSLANSAFCGLSVEVTRLGHAVSVLGLDMLEALVTATAAFRVLEKRTSVAAAEAVWRHSRVVADLAECLVHRRSSDKRVLASCVQAALLHDIGRLVIAELLPDSMEIIESLLTEPSRRRLQAEQAVIGAGHDQIGGWLMTLWGLPAVTVDSARCHNDIAAAQRCDSPVALMVAVANTLLAPDISGEPEELERRARKAGLFDNFDTADVTDWLEQAGRFLS